MGIRGLTGWIKWAAPSTIKTPTWSDYSGKKIGVDILGQLYKVKAQRRCPLLYMAQFIVECRKLNITPIFIFDGKPPNAKRAALKQRSIIRNNSINELKTLETYVSSFVSSEEEKAALNARIQALTLNTSYFSSEERDLCKQLCYAAGVISLNASCEADDVLAYLYKNNTIAAVVSCDLDMLTRGVRNLLVPESTGMPGTYIGWCHYDLEHICKEVSFTYDQFVEMCVLMGCDYNVGTRCLPYRSAYWAIKYRGDLLKTLDVLGVADEAPYYDAIARLKGLVESESTLMGIKQWNKLLSGAPIVECDSLLLFRKGPLKDLSNIDYNLLNGST